MFDKSERSSFKYWFAHLCAFNMTALNLKAWKFKYLFHDFEKPWLMWLWKDYTIVQIWHRQHNRHHLEYTGKKNYDFEAMIIDWECSRFTKSASPQTAQQEYERLLSEKTDIPIWVKHGIESTLIKFNLHTEQKIYEY